MPQFDVTIVPSEIFWTLVTFALLFGLLRWLILPRLAAILDRRTKIIEEEIAEAKRQREESEGLKLDYQMQIEHASDDARRMFDESDARVRQHHEQKMDEWKADMKRQEEAFREETENTTQQAVREIRAEAADMAIDETEKLIRENVGEQEAEDMLNKAIAELNADCEKPRKH